MHGAGYNRLYNEYMNKTTNAPTRAVDIKSAGLHRSWVKDTYLHIYELSNSSFNLEKKLSKYLYYIAFFTLGKEDNLQPNCPR